MYFMTEEASMDSNEVVNSRVCIGEHYVRTCMYVAKTSKWNMCTRSRTGVAF